MTSGQRSDDTQSAAPFDGMCGPPGFPVFYDSVRTCANAHRFELLDDTLNTCATDPRRRGIRISRLPRWLTTSRLLPRCRRSQAIPISGESGYSPDVSLMESMRLPALPMGLHPSITRTPASTPGRPPGQPCHKGTLSSIAITLPAVASRHHARTGGQRKVKWPPPFGGGHPRACGGTGGRECRPVSVAGLSPRLRGNLDTQTSHKVSFGSIPAPAGEPVAVMRRRPWSVVYPRACGGTLRRPPASR